MMDSEVECCKTRNRVGKELEGSTECSMDYMLEGSTTACNMGWGMKNRGTEIFRKDKMLNLKRSLLDA